MTDYSKMSDQEINQLVGMAISRDNKSIIASDGNAVIHEYADCGEFKGLCLGWKVFDPCNNQADAWLIIVDNGINILWHWNENGLHGASANPIWEYEHENVLRAAMIVFLMMQEK